MARIERLLHRRCANVVNLHRQKVLKNPRSWDWIDLTQIKHPIIWKENFISVEDLSANVQQFKDELADKNEVIASLKAGLDIFKSQCVCL